jgi:hypothetical protein
MMWNRRSTRELADIIEKQLADSSVPPRWDDFDEFDWRLTIAALRMAPQNDILDRGERSEDAA